MTAAVLIAAEQNITHNWKPYKLALGRAYHWARVVGVPTLGKALLAFSLENKALHYKSNKFKL